MSVENSKVIDSVSINLNGSAVLTISDHLEWDSNNEHLILLQDKINAYLDTIESNDLYDLYPSAKGRNIIINVAVKYPPNLVAKDFFRKTKAVLESAGYDFNFQIVPN